MLKFFSVIVWACPPIPPTIIHFQKKQGKLGAIGGQAIRSYASHRASSTLWHTAAILHAVPHFQIKVTLKKFLLNRLHITEIF